MGLEMPNKPQVTPVTVEVDTVAKLLKKMLANHEIGSFYNYTYQGNIVAIVDSTKAGKMIYQVRPSAWATKLAESLWEYELDESVTVDPTTVDTTTEGWTALLITDADAIEDDDEEIVVDEEAEMLADSEAEAEALMEALNEDDYEEDEDYEDEDDF
jgi:hypothetical protein